MGRIIGGALFGVLVIAGCSNTQPVTEPAAGAAQTAAEWCEAGANRIVERFERFLEELPEISAEEFLGLDEIDGLAEFQTDIAQIISATSDQYSTLCDLDGLQDLVGERLRDVERDGLLAEFLVATIREGRELTTADLAVRPGDDVEAVLSLLDDGSTLSFAAGIYELERPLLVERSITFLGESKQSTTILSTSVDAAIVVVGRGELIMRNLAVEHQGDRVASVVLAFDRPVDFRDVSLSGGVANDEGGSGNGLVLTDEAFGGASAGLTERPRSVVTATVIKKNDGAGIVVNGARAPRVERSEISENGICGICFFGPATGEIVDSTLGNNEFGIQVGDDGSPTVSGNTIEANTTAGMAIIGTASPVVESNTFELNGEIGIAVQESSAPLIADNILRSNPFGISLLSDGSAVVRGNNLMGGEVGIQADGQSAPLVENNRLVGTLTVGIAISGQAGGSFLNNEVDVGEDLGVVVEGDATPVIDGLVVTGGGVAVAYASSGGGLLANGVFTDQEIGIQIDESSRPDISDIEIVNPASAGIVARGIATASVTDVRITGSGEVGFAVADMAEVTLQKVEVVGGLTGGSLVGTSVVRVSESTFEDLEIGIQVGEQAEPMLLENAFTSMRSAGVVFVGDSAGVAERNRIRDPGIVGIQLGDNAHPELDANVLFVGRPEAPADNAVAEATGEPEAAPLEESATVGILYAGEAAGTASQNQIVGFVIGVQVSESAAPKLEMNSIDSGILLGVGVLYRDDSAGVAVGNETTGHAVGFQIGDSAMPLIESNTVITARNVAFLVQGVANPTLQENTCPEGLAGIGLLNGTDPERTDNECVEVVGE